MEKKLQELARESLTPPVVTFKIEQPTPLKRYALQFLVHTLGYPAVECDDGDCDLYYGNRLDSCRNALSIRQDSSHVIPADVTQLGANENPRIAFDIVGATTQLLTDSVNAARTYDSFDRLTYPSSFQSRKQCGRIPLINAYAECLRRPLERHCGSSGMPLLPQGKRAAIGLSHDVDRLERWADVRGFLHTGKHALYAGRSIWLNVIHRHDRFQLLRQLIDREKRLGFTSTFLFATESRYSAYGARHDVAYDIRQPAVRGLLDYLQNKGFEIGLHASFNALENEDRFVAEREQLQSLTGAEISGVRHHCWHLGRDVDTTLAMHEKAGFSYDSSLAFNYDLAFRRSVALPYYPWFAKEQRPLRVLQLPVFCMDGNLFYRDVSVESALEEIMGMIANLKEWGGVGVIDWHSDTAHPGTRGYERWGEAYCQLLEALAEDSSLWVANLSELDSWFTGRNRQLESQRPLMQAANAATA